MRILVTGGAGLLGTAIVRHLLNHGDVEVTVLDRQPPGPAHGEFAARVTWVQGDLGSETDVRAAVRDSIPEVIYHLGGMLSVPSDENPAAAFRANAAGTFHILEAARIAGVRQVLYSSTVATYGLGIDSPVVDDHTVQRPLLFYGGTKVFGEHMGLFYRHKYGLDFRGLRYPAIVGPGVRSAGIAQYKSQVVEAAIQGEPYTIRVAPETRHAFVYIEDAARAMLELAAADRSRIKEVNYVLGGIQPPVSAEELVAAIKVRIPSAEIHFDIDPQAQAAIDRLSRPLDDRRARDEWGWRPKYDLAATVDHFLESSG